MNRNKLFIYSLTSLAVMASSMAHASQLVTAPTFEGGLTATIGTFYVQPSSENLAYEVVTDTSGGINDFESVSTVYNLDPEYSFGLQAALGYIFEDTANGIELSYRNLGTSDSASTTFPVDEDSQAQKEEFDNVFTDTNFEAGFELNAFDLMISQFIDIGTHMQMRFNGGLAYVELEEQGTRDRVTAGDVIDPGKALEELIQTQTAIAKSEFTGWGPRVGIDARYDFGQGIGIVGGGSLAYYLGEFDFNSNHVTETFAGPISASDRTVQDDIDGQSVTNLRANLGIDYVYFFEGKEGSTLGLELGYLVDYYADGVIAVGVNNNNTTVLPYDVTFSGPYLNLKGAF